MHGWVRGWESLEEQGFSELYSTHMHTYALTHAYTRTHKYMDTDAYAQKPLKVITQGIYLRTYKYS